MTINDNDNKLDLLQTGLSATKGLIMDIVLKEFLDELEVKQFYTENATLVVSKFRGEIVFQISGNPANNRRVDAEHCSPNTVADICINQLDFPLTSRKVVEISNWA